MEQWKEIEGSNGQYFISNVGRVLSKGNSCSRKDKILKPQNKNGYLVLNLRINGKEIKVRIHRLVAMAFIPNPENKPFVNHKDNNRTNNESDNLEWVTHQENLEHYFTNFHEYKVVNKIDKDIMRLLRKHKITKEQLREIV
jgi:hypothetical protein